MSLSSGLILRGQGISSDLYFINNYLTAIFAKRNTHKNKIKSYNKTTLNLFNKFE